MEKLAPLEYALDWDNVGLQIGSFTQNVSTVLVTLTITEDILKKAVAEGVDLIISHHPLIFKPLRKIDIELPLGKMLQTIIKNDMAIYVSHTNLDQAPFGLNHWLARELDLNDSKILIPHSTPDVGLGRIGKIKPTSLKVLAQTLDKMWDTSVRVIGDVGQTVSTCAVVGGSGGDFISNAKIRGADVFITGDLSYHDAIDAAGLGLAVIDAGHFATEKIMVSEVSKFLVEEFGHNINVLEECGEDPFYL